VQELFDQFVDLGSPVEQVQVRERGAGGDLRRGEQPAAVLVGRHGDLRRADGAGLVDDLLLVPAQRRAQRRERGRLVGFRRVGGG
jgi:hypothetical protein